MALKFITGNKNKFEEIKAMLAPIEMEQVDMDLQEIQSLDAKEIIQHKLQEALQHEVGEFIVEDTSVYLECLNNKLPGPYIKWFLGSIGAGGIADLAERMGNKKAYAVSLVGYAKDKNDIRFFEGRNDGEIVSPIGEKDFGWGPIFKPEGSEKTYGQMEREEKYSISMRAIATKKLKEFLNSK
jgi:inosine triphosphate pyrophosphatase